MGIGDEALFDWLLRPVLVFLFEIALRAIWVEGFRLNGEFELRLEDSRGGSI